MNQMLCTLPQVKKETLRYLGYGTASPSKEEEAIILSCLSELAGEIHPRSTCREFFLVAKDGHGLYLADSEKHLLCPLPGRDIVRHLKGCEKVLLFGATLGSGPDRLLQRYGLLQVSRAAVLQAAAAAVLEEFCDQKALELAERYAPRELFLRPRFSPGYGDLPLEFQKELFRFLPLRQTIGLTLTDGLLMCPTKSVTALIGLSKAPTPCADGCRTCQKTDCEYRQA